ncbi:MAG: squalene synthase HpnC [Acidobacteria bacterium]|nr:squalene synthase HpnC [Acidobacteriota bacterium]
MSAGSSSQRVAEDVPRASTSLSGWRKLPASYAIPERPPTPDEARAYCERLARSRYENFAVATWFLPRRLWPHFFAVYAYCRISDDLGDEVGDPQESLELLDAWEAELDACYTGSPRHPVFVALAESVRACDIPRQPFADLLKAFRQDQTVHRYATFRDLLGYCRYSANPVGRLVLYVCGYRDEARQHLSDSTCTALQLANFWQDVAVDYEKGRIYLPVEDMVKFGVSETEIAARSATSAFRELLQFQVARARKWFEQGLPLAKQVDASLALDIELFTRGGQEILNAIEAQGFDVLRRRPLISRARKLWLVARAAARQPYALLRDRG